jgi:UDP-N-acetylmuramyl pentapeptide phosphotransferase/UDP-N-acetylglucosamine-1-phosphate transferase
MRGKVGESVLTGWVLLFVVALMVSFVGTWLLSSMGRFSDIGLDLHAGVQKFHARPTSRLGGIAIVLGLGAALLVQSAFSAVEAELTFWLAAFLLACAPVFLGGIIEDLTHKVHAHLRLVLSVISASIAFFYLHVGVTRTDVLLVDMVLSLPAASYLVTLLVVAGFTQSVNIIDGFHGLASGVVVIMLACLAAMAWTVNDHLVMQLCLITAAATIGFFMLNWPMGKIFLGDAGAYLLGFWVVELGLFLTNRNPTISPMAAVVVGVLPLIETMFSMYRRKFVRQHPIHHPDSLHMHTLIYRRLVLSPARDRTDHQVNAANARVALYLWPPVVLFGALACLTMTNTHAQLLWIIGFAVLYVWVYQRLVGFRAPGWLARR